MREDHFTFSSDDKQAEIFCYRWQPEEGTKQRGALLIVHGMAEHAARYAHVAERLTKEGFVVYAHDQRGHGKTARNKEDLGFFAEDSGWLRVVQDISTLLTRIQQAHPSLPIFLIGHSMGSFLSQYFIFDHSDKLAGVILSAAVDTVGPLRRVGQVAAQVERLRIGKRGRSKLLHAMSFGDFNKPFQPSRTDFDWLSRDHADVDAYIADPLCGFVITTQMWLDCLFGFGEIARRDLRTRIRKDLPIYLVGGDRDPVTRKGAGLKGLAQAYADVGLRDITLRLYPEGRHEIFNETNREDVLHEIAAWLLRLAPQRG